MPWLRRLFGIADGRTATIAAIRERYHPDDREWVVTPTATAFADPRCGAFQERFRVVKDDGGIVWLEARAAIFRGRDGSALRSLRVMLDVTDEMLREQELDAGRKRFRAERPAQPNLQTLGCAIAMGCARRTGLRPLACIRATVCEVQVELGRTASRHWPARLLASLQFLPHRDDQDFFGSLLEIAGAAQGFAGEAVEVALALLGPIGEAADRLERGVAGGTLPAPLSVGLGGRGAEDRQRCEALEWVDRRIESEQRQNAADLGCLIRHHILETDNDRMRMAGRPALGAG